MPTPLQDMLVLGFTCCVFCLDSSNNCAHVSAEGRGAEGGWIGNTTHSTPEHKNRPQLAFQQQRFHGLEHTGHLRGGEGGWIGNTTHSTPEYKNRPQFAFQQQSFHGLRAPFGMISWQQPQINLTGQVAWKIKFSGNVMFFLPSCSAQMSMERFIMVSVVLESLGMSVSIK